MEKSLRMPTQHVITKLASSGHDLIFTTSFKLHEPDQQVAKRFKKPHLSTQPGIKDSRKCRGIPARFYEGRYVVGKIVGKMTKTNTIYVASFPIPKSSVESMRPTCQRSRLTQKLKSKLFGYRHGMIPAKKQMRPRP